MQIGALIVDDEPDIRQLIAMAIESRNQGLFVCGEAATGEEALSLAEETDPKVVVLDERMPGMSGIETAAELLRRRPRQHVIMCSAYLDADLRQRAEAVGIEACLSKLEIHRVPEMMFAVAGEN